MDSSAEWVSPGPATSPLIRILFYLGEAMMAGGLLAIYSGIASFLVVIFRGVSASELLGAGIMVVVFFVLTIRNVWAFREASQESPRTSVYEEWTETRQWRWVIDGAITIFGLLALVSGGLLMRGEQWIGERTFQATVFLVFGTLIVGICLRVGIQHRLEKHYPEK